LIFNLSQNNVYVTIIKRVARDCIGRMDFRCRDEWGKKVAFAD
jgi:hypothetical protein